jgi:hypothetical protein
VKVDPGKQTLGSGKTKPNMPLDATGSIETGYGYVNICSHGNLIEFMLTHLIIWFTGIDCA